MADRIYVTRDDSIQIEQNNLVTLTTAKGETFHMLEPRLLFPVSAPEDYITLLNEDGVEIALIRKLSELSSESLHAVRQSLDDYYLVPHITKILSSDEKYGTLRLVVDTDRGIKNFDIRNRNHDITVFKNGMVRLRDSDDNRYIIDDYRALDAASRAKLIANM